MNRTRLCATVFLAITSATAASAPASHCTEGEEIIFTCQTGSKVLSLCAPKTEESLSPAWIQYRFGRMGSIEFTHPRAKTSPSGNFRYSTQKGPRWVTAALEFSNSGFSYVLIADGNSNTRESGASLLIVSPDGSRKVLECSDQGLYAAAGLWRFEQYKLPEVPKELMR